MLSEERAYQSEFLAWATSVRGGLALMHDADTQ
jgi:hypothetical protein